jgi:hypothetical protein
MTQVWDWVALNALASWITAIATTTLALTTLYMVIRDKEFFRHLFEAVRRLERRVSVLEADRESRYRAIERLRLQATETPALPTAQRPELPAATTSRIVQSDGIDLLNLGVEVEEVVRLPDAIGPQAETLRDSGLWSPEAYRLVTRSERGLLRVAGYGETPDAKYYADLTLPEVRLLSDARKQAEGPRYSPRGRDSR